MAAVAKVSVQFLEHVVITCPVPIISSPGISILLTAVFSLLSLFFFLFICDHTLRNSVLGLCWNAWFGNMREFLVHVTSSNHIKPSSTQKCASVRQKERSRDVKGEGQIGQFS